jgi:hypothetical protein
MVLCDRALCEPVTSGNKQERRWTMGPDQGLTVTLQFKGAAAESWRCDRVIVAAGAIRLLLTQNGEWLELPLVNLQSVEVE